MRSTSTYHRRRLSLKLLCRRALSHPSRISHADRFSFIFSLIDTLVNCCGRPLSTERSPFHLTNATYFLFLFLYISHGFGSLYTTAVLEILLRDAALSKKKLATNTAFMDVRPKRNEGRISQFDIIRTQKSNFSRKIHCHSEVRSIEYIRHGNVAYFPAVQGQNRRLTSFIPLLDRFTT